MRRQLSVLAAAAALGAGWPAQPASLPAQMVVTAKRAPESALTLVGNTARIEAERIRLTPDSRVCEDCARDVLPPEEPPSGPVRRRFRRGAASDRASDRR